MAKFNVLKRQPAATGPIVAERVASGTTYESGAGYAHDAKSELFLLAVANFVGEDTFYEKASDRDTRYADLVRTVAAADPDWMRRFVRWLRTGANMRSAAVVAGLEAARALLAAGVPGGRGIVADSMARADEPGEALAYWTSRYGRAIPKPVKRGIADAALRLYAEYPLLRYDTGSHGVRFADVIELTHPGDRRGSAQGGRWQGAWQRDLFAYAIDRRHNRDSAAPQTLTMVRANAALRELAEGDPQAMLDTERLRAAGMTWEDVLSLVGSKVAKAQLWEALIPVMGLMALARNLRNFDEAGVSDAAADKVIARFTDPAQVAKSRMLPYRWLAAYEQAPSLRWAHALNQALQASLAHLPALPGRSLILVDTSASMSSGGFSARSAMTPVKAAAVFGVALAARGEAVDLHGFADGVFRHEVRKGASVIREVDRFVKRTGEVGHGTRIADSIRATFHGQERVFVISDMQTFAPAHGGDVTDVVARRVPLYGFNLGGYKHTAFDAGTRNRYELGGLTDATFRMIPLIEAGRNADWPF
jgi:hypothetical protein